MPIGLGVIIFTGLAGWIAHSVKGTADAGEQTVDHVAKAAPWIVAGVAVYALAVRGR